MESTQISAFLAGIRYLHDSFVFQRRVRILAEVLASQIPQHASVLDVGCGDGTIAALVAKMRPDVAIQGVDVMVRRGCKIACSVFDGTSLPFPDSSFDVCIFVDVLHHTRDLAASLREASRVSRSFVVIKDHLGNNAFDRLTLGFMDWVGNRPHGVRLTYDFRSRRQWTKHFEECGLAEMTWMDQVPLYPAPFSFLFGRRLHFVSLLTKEPRRGAIDLARHRESCMV